MRVFSATLICLSTIQGLVLASLYPTRPVADTIWTPGRTEWITWRDDRRQPHLRQMGLFDIDLYSGQGTYIRTLARHVEPMRRHHQIVLPKDMIPNGSYFVRFKCKNPRTVVYSADFMSKDSEDNSTNITVQALLTPGVSSLATAATTAPAAVTTIHTDSLSDSHRTNGNIFSRSRLDLEKLKFKLIIVLWPALIGLSMAI